MILQKWNEALIDWVNCLSLTDRISVIQDLKNGEFFRLLLKKLSSSEVLNECASNCFDDIYNLLEKEFPLYGVHEIERDESQLSYIASLLLLLSVTKEKTPLFQSNLCENLSHNSQVKIKYFLESCLASTNDLNHSYLKTVIEGDVVSPTQFSPKVKDNVTIKTPMKDFFDSPRETNKLKRDVKRLETENETILLEKLELEDELRAEKEKRHRIEEALGQKTELVLKLREELQDFIQNSNSKADEDNLSSQSVSAIKSELKDLEKYVTALEEEKAALFEENEKLLEKMTILQSKNKDLELQSVHAETKQQELLAMLHNRNEEVSSLREHCLELEEKINALPSALNMSIDSDGTLPLGNISSPFRGERLSSAVVDVKLAEVEEENEKYKDEVKILINQREVLTDQLKELREELDLEKKEVKDSRIKIETMMIDLEGLKESNASKENALMELRAHLTEQDSQINFLNSERERAVAEKELLNSNILSLNDNIKFLEETKEEILKENLQLKLQLSECENKISDLRLQYEECQDILRDMTEEISNKTTLGEKLSLEIQDCKEQLRTVSEERDSTKEIFCQIEKYNHELKEILSNKESLITSLRESDDQKEEAIQILKKQVDEQINFIHSMELAQKAVEAVKEQVEEELEKYKCQLIEKERFAEKAKQDMDDKLKIITVEMGSLKESCTLKEKTLKELENQLNEQENLIHSLEDNVKFLEKAKEEVAEENIILKFKLSESENKVCDLDNKLEECKKNLECVSEELFHKTCFVDQLMLEKEDFKVKLEILKNEKDEVQETISLKDKSYQEMKEKHEKAFQDQQKQLKERETLIQSMQSAQKDLETEKNELEKVVDTLNDQVQGARSLVEARKQEIDGLREELEMMKSDMENVIESNASKEISLLEFEGKLKGKDDIIQSLETIKEAAITEKKLLESNILSLKNSIKLLEETKEEILTDNSHYKIQLLELSGKLSALEMTLQLKEKHLQNLREELAEKNILAENMKHEMQNYKGEMEIMRVKIDSMEETICLKENECEEMMEKIINKDNMIVIFEKDVYTKEKYIEELSNKLNVKTHLLNSLESVRETLEADRKQLESELKQINSEINEKDSVAEKAKWEIIEYRDKFEKVMVEMKDVKESCILKEKMLQEVNHQLCECNNKIKSMEETEVAMVTEKKELEERILSLGAQVKLMEETKEEILKENSHYKSQTLDYGSKISDLESKLEEQERKLVNLTNELSTKNSLVERMEAKVKNFEDEIETMKKEKNSSEETISMKEKVNEEMKRKLFEMESTIESLEADKEGLMMVKKEILCLVDEQRITIEKLKDVKDSCILKEKMLQEVNHQLCECNDKIKSMEETEVAMVTEKKELEERILSLEAQLKLTEDTKEAILKENSHYKTQTLDYGSKISDLENKIEEQERKLINLTNELSTKNSLVERMEAKVKNFEDEVETMKKEKSSSEETISMKEKVNEEMKQKLSEIESTIQSLEADKEGLMVEKKKTECLVDEQRITMEVLQQKLDSLNEEKILLEDKLSWWKAQSEAFEKMLEEMKIQASLNKLETVNAEDAPKYENINSGTENEFKHATLSENATCRNEQIAVGSNLKDSAAQTSCNYTEKNGNLNGDNESFSSENVGCLLDRTVDEGKLRELDVDKIMLLVNSWHDIDTTLEKLRVVECQLKAKICSLWESVPRIQSKLKERMTTVSSAQISMKDTDQAKEVIMRIISMVRSLEKHNSSLEKELVHASSNAVSWGLQGIQNQFNVVTSTPNTDNANTNLNLRGEQKNEFSSFLDNLRDKASQVLEDVNSSEEIFKEVELRSANVAEALEYLKKNCLFEKEMLSDVDYEGFKISLTEEETRERLIKAMDEMEKAKEDLERIAYESRKEVEILQNEKENLEQELKSMAAHCSILENKLEMSGKHVELAVQETQQRIQKIYEKKLEATKEKWKSLYMDDFKKYEEESKMRKQFEESFKKYRNLAEDYEKRLSEATAQTKDLKSKVLNLQHQKSCLEMKLRESRAKTLMEDEHRDSLDLGVNRSNYVDVMANYFARTNSSSPSHSMFDLQGDANQDRISRSFSRESVQSSLPSGMGRVFCAEDEEGELFNATYLNDLNEGKCIIPSGRASKAEACSSVLRDSNKQIRNPTYDEDTPNRRIKELMRRNTLCLPHLKSSYPTETQFHDPKNFPEELLKGNFSLKAPLLGDKQPRRLSGNIIGDLRRKKDIGQTTYMKPGPPTPGKNRRTSLQGSEQGSEQGRIPSTPGRFRAWFARGKKTVPNGDVENIPFTPRTKQKGLFQRAMANLERDGS